MRAGPKAEIPRGATCVRVTQVYEPVPRPWKEDPDDSTRSVALTNSELIEALSTCFEIDSDSVVVRSMGRPVRLSICGDDVAIRSESPLDELTDEEAFQAQIVFHLEFVVEWPSDLVAQDDFVIILADVQRRVNECASTLRRSGRTRTARLYDTAREGIRGEQDAAQRIEQTWPKPKRAEGCDTSEPASDA
jgi:hypothetical protein